MSAHDRLQIARDSYRAYEVEDRDLIDRLLSDDFIFYSPPDPGIDREAYFERCWPNAGNLAAFEFKRLVEIGDEVLVTYECTRKAGADRAGGARGTRFRNTEVLTIPDGKITKAEVYFGWNL